MGLDVKASGALLRRLALQERIDKSSHAIFTVKKTADDFRSEIRNYLSKASDHRLIAESRDQIRKLVVMSGPPKDIPDATQSLGTSGPRNFKRDPALPHFTRAADHAMFDFQISLQEIKRELNIIAYGFELRLPPDSPVSFIRFDLSPPKHDNQLNGLRSHIHLGSDDDGYSIPSPMMSPFEVFDIFIHLATSTNRARLPQ